MATGGARADELSKFGTGRLYRELRFVISLVGEFGMRQEEVPGPLPIVHEWVNKSADSACRNYEKMVPDYAIKAWDLQLGQR